MTRDAASPRFCLVLEVGETGDTGARLREALDAAGASAATVILRSPGGSKLAATAAKPIVTLAQARGIAVLIENDVDAARSLGADGVHLTWRQDPEDAYETARNALGPDRIVGVDAGSTRHDAMELAERGADYVGFDASAAGAPDQETALRRRLELVAWWAELFEVPVVALGVASPEDAGDLAAAGADFIAITIPQEAGPSSVEAWLASFSTALHASRAA